MRTKILFLTIVCVFLSSHGANANDSNFSIHTIREIKSKELINVGGDWINDPERLLVTVRAKEDIPSKSVIAKAYFFDADKNLVASYKEPSRVWTSTPRGMQGIGLPAELQRNRQVNIHFAITTEMKDARWRTAIVVFGSGDDLVVGTRPSADIADFEFPKKKVLLASKDEE